MGEDDRRKGDAGVGGDTASLRSEPEVPDAALLRRRTAESCFPVLELPLESPDHGRQRLCRHRTQPPRPARLRQRMERGGKYRLDRSVHERLPLRHRRCGPQSAFRGQGPARCRRCVFRRILRLLSGRHPRQTFQVLHCTRRCLQPREHVHRYRGGVVQQLGV